MTVMQTLHNSRLPHPKAMLELIKPITWFPPMWAYLCGIVSVGVSPWQAWPMVVLGVILAGPVVCGMSQAANDWCDRHVDAVNEPNRPIPSGRIPGRWGLWIALTMSVVSLALGWLLGPWGFAATITWLMMIFGIAVTATVVGKFPDPYSPALLLKLVAVVCAGAFALTCLAIAGIEAQHVGDAQSQTRPLPFRQGLAEVWREPRARNFTLFIFLSMTACFMQELILERYAGFALAFTPGQSTQLSGAQNGGVFVGRLLVGFAATGLRVGSLRTWVTLGCLGSAAALAAIALAGQVPVGVQILLPTTVALGLFNGMFAVAAIGSMMALAGEGRSAREGTRMGLWGASQAIAAGIGGLTGAAAVDLFRLFADAPTAFGLVFIAEAALFGVAALMALHVIEGAARAPDITLVPGE